MRTLTFNGTRSSYYGVWISGEGAFDAPARSRTLLTVPGRDGNLILDNGRFENITITYPAMFTGLAESASPYGGQPLWYVLPEIKRWLMSPTGYVILTDDYNANSYRKAVFSGGLDVEPTAWAQKAKFDLTFNAMPQRWLNGGDTYIPITLEDLNLSETGLVSKPLIRCTVAGTGYVRITNRDSTSGTVYSNTITMTGINDTVIVDCDRQMVYSEATETVYTSQISGSYPVIGRYRWRVYAGGDVSSVEVAPMWWVL